MKKYTHRFIAIYGNGEFQIWPYRKDRVQNDSDYTSVICDSKEQALSVYAELCNHVKEYIIFLDYSQKIWR